MKTKYIKTKIDLLKLINDNLNSGDEILSIFERYQKDNIELIEKLKRERKVEHNRIKGALKQSINAHPIITKDLIGSVTKRIIGSLIENKSNKEKIKEKVSNKISSIYHTFYYTVIFILKCEFMKSKSKISITISENNNKQLIEKSINKSKLVDKLLTEYFKNDK